MIVHSEARTTETQKRALELKTCLAALNQIVQFWEGATGEQRVALAHGLFEYVVIDLTTQKISDGSDGSDDGGRGGNGGEENKNP